VTKSMFSDWASLSCFMHFGVSLLLSPEFLTEAHTDN
jgi:hypothetical protein